MSSIGVSTSTCESSPYKTLAERHIRLLEILPPGADGQISCRLVTFSLESDNLQYVAVSYTWGRPDPDCYVQLNGQRQQVRKNLLRFLHEIEQWQRYQSALFWIDALCIDQSNDQEKSDQVKLMAKIYKNAEHVLVWLGPRYADSDLALKALNRGSEDRLQSRKIERTFWKPEGAAIRSLCERAYWTRLWVLQELVHAKATVLICGSKSFSWNIFVSFCELAQSCTPTRRALSFEHLAFLNSPATSMVRSVHETTLQKAALFDLVFSCRSLGCLEPRDKVYALLGIAVEGKELVTPNYTTSLLELANAVLRAHHLIRPPTNLEQISNQARDLSEVFGVDIMNYDSTREYRAPDKLPKVSRRMLHAPQSNISLWWANAYDHAPVQKLWLASQKQQTIDGIVFAAVAVNDVPMVRMLEKLRTHKAGDVRVDFNCVNEHGQRPFLEAARLGHAETVKILCESNASLLYQFDSTGNTAIYHAAIEGHVDVVRYLASYPTIDLNERGCSVNQTAPILHLTIQHGREEIVKLLVERPEMDVNVRYGHFGSALEHAVTRQSLPIVEMLLHREDLRPESNTLHRAAQFSTVEIFKTLLNHQAVADINSRDGKGWPVLFVAVARRRLAITELIIGAKGFDPAATDYEGNTALHWIVRHQDPLIQDLIVAQSGLDFNVKNKAGHTALYDAVEYDNERMQELILRSGRIQAQSQEAYVVRNLAPKAYQEYCDLARAQGFKTAWGLPAALGSAMRLGR